MNYDYDVIVIGGGTAGLGAYRKAKSFGKKALIIEANDFVTTCANVGCMPSKLLIAAAENMEAIEKSKEFGIDVEQVKINNDVLWKRVRSERDRFVGFVKKGAYSIDEKDRIIGFAKFIDKNTILINNQKITSKTFVIATGSSPVIPVFLKELKDEILTNENIFELEKLPKSIAVLGAGVIGLELGFALKNLGSKVHLFSKGKSILKLNKNINEYLVSHIENNMDFEYNEEIKTVEKLENGYRIKTNSKTIEVEKILVAIGRKSNIDNIDLTVWVKENPISLYNRETTQLGHYPIFLAGDVNNDVTLLHEASKEATIAGENASIYPNVKDFKRDTNIGIIFSSPQIMQVGNTTNLPENCVVGNVSFEDQGRSRVMLKNKGMLNIYFDKNSRKLIGAEMIGPSAEHIAHLLCWSIEKNTTIDEMVNFPYYHPVVEEGLRTAVRDAFAKF